MKKRILLVVLITVITEAVLLKGDISNLYGFTRAVLSYYGSTGDEVINIQVKLKNWGYYDDVVDGVYGYKTYKAVRYFQYKNGLNDDGIAGTETLSALGLSTGSAVETYSSNSNRNVDLLGHLVEGEARGEPYVGQVAVAAAVLNRTRDSRFPKTIAGVIYQPGAFTAVDDGQINLEPSKSSINAARDALNGWDPSGGAVYYFNPATATSSWIWSRQQIMQIGKHIFAR